MACVDTAPATDVYKLLQLRQCLSGEALDVIENLGHSTAAYEAAKEQLERRYGGKRRQAAIYLNDIDNFPQVRPGNADLLEIAIMNLKETDHQRELGNGFLYAKLQTKLAESMLARSHRWVFQTQTQKSVYALKTWVFQEAEFQTIASETVHGIACTIGSTCIEPPQDSSAYGKQTTFFGATVDHHITETVTCQVYGEGHNIEACEKFMKKDVPGRWIAAKRFKLCFCCLGNGHLGKACQNSRLCGQHGCQKVHHTLLHKESYHVFSTSDQSNTNHNALDTAYIGINSQSADRCTRACTEGNDCTVKLPVRTTDVYTTCVNRPFPSTKLDHRRKLDKVDMSRCTRASIAYKFDNTFKSKMNVSDRNYAFNVRNSTSLTDSKDEECLRCPMEGNYSKSIQT